MRILFVCTYNSIYKKDNNPFVKSLAEGMKAKGCYVDCDLDRFWNDFESFDIIFLQWPESIFQWNKKNIDLVRLSNHFDLLKKKKIKTIVTCHNLHPHNNDELTTKLYNLVYSKTDAIHHMGTYSYDVLKEKYPETFHFIVPHHVADEMWSSKTNTSDIKRKLGIPSQNIVISAFGEFRNKDEVELFMNMAKDVGRNGITYLAPRIPIGKLYNGRWINKSINFIFKYIRYKLLGVKYAGFLSDEELNEWRSASDIVFIQRKDILNSGNIALAFSAKKIVIGPDVGNVGEILKDSDNYVFNPCDRTSIYRVTLNAINDTKQNSELGEMNYKYAMKNWNCAKVCQDIISNLERLISS